MISIKGRGNTTYLEDAIYVPKLEYRNISIAKLSEKNSVHNKNDWNIIRMIETKKNGLYELT
jgi:hypothetical protein